MKNSEKTVFLINFQIKNVYPLFSFEKFNLAVGSLYQKYKNNVSPELFDTLKSFENFDIRLIKPKSNLFKFILVGDIASEKVNEIALNIVKFAKEIHKSKDNVELCISRHVLPEELIALK